MEKCYKFAFVTRTFSACLQILVVAAAAAVSLLLDARLLTPKRYGNKRKDDYKKTLGRMIKED